MGKSVISTTGYITITLPTLLANYYDNYNPMCWFPIIVTISFWSAKYHKTYWQRVRQYEYKL